MISSSQNYIHISDSSTRTEYFCATVDNYRDAKIRISAFKFTLFNNNFRKITCDTIIVNETSYGDLDNFPSSAKKIVFNKAYFNSLSGCNHMKNIKELEFNDCEDLKNIFSAIKDMKVSVKIINCPKFNEYDLLKRNNIAVTTR